MHKSGGFTLVELFIALAVAAVLLTLAAPAFLDTIARARLDSAAGSIVGAINLARSEAIKRARVVTLCSRATDGSGNPACGDADNWEDGWIVFSAGEAIPLRVGDPTRDISVATVDVSVEFEPNGARVGDDDPALCLAGRSDSVRLIGINRVGRVTNEKLEACP